MNERLTGTMSAPGTDRQWQVRLLPIPDEQGGIWVQPLDERKGELNEWIAAATEMHVALNLDHTRYAFETSILRRNKHLWVTEQLMVEGLLLRAPDDFRTADRRAHHRLQVPDGCAVVAELTRPLVSPAETLQVKLWDVSPAGLGMVCPYKPWLNAIQPGTELRVSVNFRGKKFAAACVVRFGRVLSNRTIKLGAQLRNGSLDAPGQAHLEELLKELTRLHEQRQRAARAAR